MNKKTVKKLWIGVLVIYLVSVSVVIILDCSLHWGFLLGVKILAAIHILFIVGIIFFYHFGSKKSSEKIYVRFSLPEKFESEIKDRTSETAY